MSIDTGLLIQGLAIAFGLSGMALSLLYLLYPAKKMKLNILSNAENIEKVMEGLDSVTTQIENTAKNMAKMNKNAEQMLLQKIDTVSANMNSAIKGVEKTQTTRTKTLMAVTKREINKLNSRIDKMRNRFDHLSASSIDTQHTMKKNDKNTAKLATKIDVIQQKLSKLHKSEREVRTRVTKLSKITLLNRNGRSNKSSKYRRKGTKGNGRYKQLAKKSRRVLIKQKVV